MYIVFLVWLAAMKTLFAFTNCSCQTLYTVLPMKALNMLVHCTWCMYFLKLKILPHFGVDSSRILANFLKVSEIPFAH